MLIACLFPVLLLADEQVMIQRMPANADEVQDGCSLVKKIYCSMMTQSNCEECLECIDAQPDHYCNCISAMPFYYGMDTIINSPLWLKTKVSEIVNNGLSAYWFSEDSLDISLFLRCDVTEGMQSMQIGPNSFSIKSPEKIRELMQDFGDLVELAGTMSVYILVKPFNGSSGRAILHKYGEGFHSTCDDLFGVYYWMQYTYSHSDNVYALPPSKAASLKFVQWTPLKVKATDKIGSVDLVVTCGRCQGGEVVAAKTLQDSTRVFLPNNQLLQAAKKANDTLYFNFSGNNRGIIKFYSTAKYTEDKSDTTICKGSNLQLGSTLITADTVLADTTWVVRDTLLINSYSINFSSADTITDTLRTEANFPLFYRGQRLRQYGDYEFMQIESGKCDVYVYLHVEPVWNTTYQKADTTICKGKTIKLGGKTISTNRTQNDTVVVGAAAKSDTRVITTWKVSFAEPELEYDTIVINKRMLPYNYEGVRVNQFGDVTLTITAKNECTRKVQLHVIESELPLQYKYDYADTTLCRGLEFEMHGKTLKTTGKLVDSVYLAEDTLIVRTWSVYFTQPELEYDTIYVPKSEMPTTYDGMLVSTYGTRTMLIEKENECTRRVQIAVYQAAEYKQQVMVEEICQGKTYEYQGAVYTTDFTYSDTTDIEEYQKMITIHNVVFTMPETEVLSDQVLLSNMPYIVADTAISDFGEHDLYIKQSGECNRHILLTLTRATEYVIEGRRDTSVCHGMPIVINGTSYWNDAVVADTLEAVDYVAKIVNVHITFTKPDVVFDTLYLETDELPYQFADTVIEDYGEYEVLVLNQNKCDELIHLAVMQPATRYVEMQDNNIKVYPTITTAGEPITIDSEKALSIQLMDVLGRVIEQKQLAEGKNRLMLSNSGHYFLKLTSGTETKIVKIITK